MALISLPVVIWFTFVAASYTLMCSSFAPAFPHGKKSGTRARARVIVEERRWNNDS